MAQSSKVWLLGDLCILLIITSSFKTDIDLDDLRGKVTPPDYCPMGDAIGGVLNGKIADVAFP